MSTEATTGVAAMASILGRVASGPAATVATVAEDQGVARSTAFDITRRLEAAGFIARDEGGLLSAGPELVRLAFAAHGVAALHGPAEALLALLRDETGATVRLYAGEALLLAFAADWDTAKLAAALSASSGGLHLTLALRPTATRAERAYAQAALERTLAGLIHYRERADA